MTTVNTNEQAGIPHDIGPALQYPIPAATLSLAVSVPSAGSVQSAILGSYGWQKGSVGVKSTQAGTLSVQRFLDAAGAIPIGAPISAVLIGGTANSVSWTDGIPYASFKITVSNSGGSAATLSNVAVLLQAG